MILGIGTDIVAVERFRHSLQRSGEALLEQVFTSSEQATCRRRRDPVPCYAARWAAKEAVLKALGTGWAEGITWTEVEIARHGDGPPQARLTGKARQQAEARGVERIHLSISHERHAATAMVVLEGSTTDEERP